MAKSRRISRPSHVVCLERGNYRIDLDVGKVYRTARPEKTDPTNMLRVIDGSGEDYLYPANWFVAVKLPPKAQRALETAGA